MSEQSPVLAMAPIDLQERRRRRSNNPLIAISYQLEQVVADFDLDACIVATEEGLTFAHDKQLNADDAQVYAALAAELLAPVLAKQHYMTHKLGDQIFAHVQEVWMWEQPLYIMAIGKTEASSHLACHRAVAGMLRIASEQRALKKKAA